MSGVNSRIPELRVPAAAAKLASWLRPADNAAELPLLHRLAIVYLMLPVVIWLVGWFEWWLGIPAALLLAAAFWQAVSGSLRISPRTSAVAVLAVAACWVMVTAAGGLFDIGLSDWENQRTRLIELVRYPWPTFLQDPLAAYAPDLVSPPPLLRYYLGYHITPALAARWFGPAVLNWAVPIWTWLGVALILLMFTRERRGWGVTIAVLAFIFFSGMDAVSMVLFEGWDWIAPRIDWEGLPGLDLGTVHIEISEMRIRLLILSNMTNVLWSPQHFIPAGLYTFLMLQLQGHRRFLAVSGVLLATAPFWSAFVAVGLLPLFAVLLWKNGLRPFLRWPNLLLAAPLAGLIALYLTSGETDFVRGWIWEQNTMRPFWSQVLLFYLLEFLLLGILVYLLRPDLHRNPFFIASMATLILLPLYYYAVYNDLLMRASMPPLLLLCWYSIETLTGSGKNEYARKGVYRLGIACMVVMLCIGSITALYELARATEDDGRFRFERFHHTFLGDLLPRVQRENTAYHIPNALRLLLDEDELPREKGVLVASSEFDIYLNENRLAFVKESCTPEDVKQTFFLHVVPSDENDLSTDRVQYGFDNLDFNFREHGILGGQLCAATRLLPNYDIDRIATGQYTEQGSIWTTEIPIGFLANLSPRAPKGVLIASSEFDIYLDENRLTFVKEPCAPEDVKPRFFLHVVPSDENDLPADRVQHGFDNLDFNFRKHGILVGQLCTAVRLLPNYDIDRIATGQYTGEGTIWTTDILLDDSE